MSAASDTHLLDPPTTMSDDEAIVLLHALADYVEAYGDENPPPTKQTVNELAIDLVASIPRGRLSLIPHRLRRLGFELEAAA